MRKLIIVGLMVTLLSGCGSTKPSPPTVAFKGTTVEDLVDKPNRDLMRLSPPKQRLSPGDTDGKAAIVISNNNSRAGTIERRLDDLQQYVCNLFKESVGEACDKDK